MNAHICTYCAGKRQTCEVKSVTRSKKQLEKWKEALGPTFAQNIRMYARPQICRSHFEKDGFGRVPPRGIPKPLPFYSRGNFANRSRRPMELLGETSTPKASDECALIQPKLENCQATTSENRCDNEKIDQKFLQVSFQQLIPLIIKCHGCFSKADYKISKICGGDVWTFDCECGCGRSWRWSSSKQVKQEEFSNFAI
ncbi:unnamed protein product [Caenorhabditis angaria]|uniref:THAP-type domain-containing protein n=1 Tax=Caenorhabditis angaria TaxID=860376 RepID=A0A9P1N062_9PELO|nr:unnamed protein product [Caenorhabditis angaria]